MSACHVIQAQKLLPYLKAMAETFRDKNLFRSAIPVPSAVASKGNGEGVAGR
jgi:Mg2+/Co2+ transporter CorC